ncbi:MAG TPA: MarR family winged helix-turn-helix transcriptional regulator [Terriglobales bacterium]|nr:MarR family winged helix-turn-helix transcriptional regulator [Terriglobales bacterium]
MAKATQLGAWSAELERLARVLNRVGPDEVCCESLTSRQCSILRTLVDKQGARLSDLAAESGITASAMTRVLEKLEARGLVQRVRGAGDDGRAAIVAITERGRAVRGRIDQLMLERTRTILKGIPAGLRPQLLAGIRMLNQALGPGGCCDFSGEWPGVGVSCRVMPNDQPVQRRTSNARQGN